MNYEVVKEIGQIVDIKKAVSNYRKNPGNLTKACQAACYYAKKHNEDMIVVEYYSYMNKVYGIAKKNEDLSSYHPGIAEGTKIIGALVTAKGQVSQVRLSK